MKYSLVLLFLTVMMAAGATLDEIRADTNPERRARAALDYAVTATNTAATEYAKSNWEGAKAALEETRAAAEIAASAMKDGRHSGRAFKALEMQSRHLFERLEDLEKEMPGEQREFAEGVRRRVEAIHDEWLADIMGGG